MAQTGYTPIKLYASSTASNVPLAANLDNTNGAELAINIADGKLFYKDSSNVVQVIATKSGASGDVVGPASATDTAVALFDGTTGKLIKNSLVTIGSTGNTVIEGTDNTNAMLRITQLGTGNVLLVEDSANPDSTPFVIDSNGRIIVGNTTATGSYAFGTNAQLQMQNAYGVFSQYSANTSGNVLDFVKSRSATIGTQTIVQSGDILGGFYASGSDGAAFIPAAQILASVDGTPGTSSMPGRLTFSTTASGASAPTERMRIDSAGQVGIGGTASAGTTLRVVKQITGAVASYGVIANGTIQSDVTSQANIFTSNVGTVASAFTLSNFRHFYVNQATIGATSSVTNQWGFVVESSMTGATNNYGFYGNIASGTGRYNFYAAGTADNYFAGNVGIGTTSPSYKLDVTSGSISLSTNNNFLYGKSTGGTNTRMIGITSSNSLYIGSLDVSVSNILFSNNGVQATLDSSGNLGLGVTPSAWGSKAFQIGYGSFWATTSASYLGQNYYFNSSAQRIYIGSSYATEYTQLNGQHIWYNAPSGTAGNAITFTQAMTLDASGNLGIGTSSPSSYGSPLAVYAATNPTLAIASGNANAYLKLSSTSDTTMYLTNTGGSMTMITANTERMRIFASGGVSIGNTTDPSAGGLNVNSNLLLSTSTLDTSTYGLKVTSSYWNTTNVPCVMLAGASSNASYYGYAQYVVGSGYKFYTDWSGAIHSTSQSITAISDATLKTNIRPLETGLSEILALQPRRFDFIDESRKNVPGFVAQEVETVLPDLVKPYIYSVDENKVETIKKGLTMGDMIPTLVKAIQELSAKVDAQAVEIAELKGN